MSGRPYIILGGGGHAKVLYWALIDSAKQVLGFIDREAKDALILGTGLRYLGNDDDLKRYPPSEVFLVNGIGSVKNTNLARTFTTDFVKWDSNFLQLCIHQQLSVKTAH